MAPSRGSQAVFNWQLNKQHQQQVQGMGVGWDGVLGVWTDGWMGMGMGMGMGMEPMLNTVSSTLFH